ncbi:MAG: hypothetical protein RIG68_03740 [Imperialibacter sp.]|uniref:hypothetical protein n=1 Tax=Imperialibacter sp. TaxID=2038411 RepID=UPI0032EE0DDB
MNFQIDKEAVSQGVAIIQDYIFKREAKKSDPTDLKLLKLLQCRESNPDFEIELAELICGEEGNSFPYRTSYQLDAFFSRLNLNFKHDGSTRRYWVENVLKQLDIKQIGNVITRGLFYKKDFKRLAKDDSNFEESYQRALTEFQSFIRESIDAGKELDLGHVLDMNVNTDLLFNQEATTNDSELNALINEAKSRFLKPGDKQVALEKIWDAFERIKTYYGQNKKESSTKLISKIASNLGEEEFNNEFVTLTKIGNNFRIRHHETDKIELTDISQIDYLFFRVLSLIDLCLSKIAEDSNNYPSDKVVSQ